MDYVFVWADGIHANALEEDKPCLLVIVGVLADGWKGTGGPRRRLPRSLLGRGPTCCVIATVVACVPGACRRRRSARVLAAMREVFPDTRVQRDWVHKTANVLMAMPKSAHPGAKAALAEILVCRRQAPRLRGREAVNAAYGAKFGKFHCEDH